MRTDTGSLGGAENAFARVATVHDVIDGTRILNSEFSRHDRQARGKGVLPSRAVLTILRTDPLTTILNSEFSRHDQQVRGKGALPSRALLTILRTDPNGP